MLNIAQYIQSLWTFTPSSIELDLLLINDITYNPEGPTALHGPQSQGEG